MQKKIVKTVYKVASGSLHPRVIACGFLGFSSGLSFLLLLSTIPVWLREYGISKTTIGFFSLTSLPYVLKFIWSPLLNAIRIPFISRAMGQRRSWFFLLQTIVMILTWMMAYTDPALEIKRALILIFLIAICSASRDAVTDAYRVETLAKDQVGVGSAMYVFGYRIGMLISSGGALFLADILDWQSVYQIMAGCVFVGVITVLVTPEPEHIETHETREMAKVTKNFMNNHPHLKTQWWGGFVARLYSSVICPIKEFVSRPSWITLLLFITLFKLGDNMVNCMANIFLLDIGFTKSDVALVSKTFGLLAAIFGGFVGSFFIIRFGTFSTLLLSGFLHMFSHFMYIALAKLGSDIGFLYATVAVTTITGGMCTATFVTFLTRLTHISYSITQYAFFTSLWSVGNLLSSPAGLLADRVSWELYYLFATLAALPGLLILLSIYKKKHILQAVRPKGA